MSTKRKVSDSTDNSSSSSSSSKKSSLSTSGVVTTKRLAKKTPQNPYDDFTLPVSTVLAEVKKLKKNLQKSSSSSPKKSSSTELEGTLEVDELSADKVVIKIEDLVINIVNQILEADRGNSFELTIPNRSSSNQKYVEDLDRIVLGDKISKRQFLNTSHVRKTAITTRVVQLVHEVFVMFINIINITLL
jgi:meiotic recombination protein SPO11